MKKFLLSIFAVLFAFAGAQAQETATLSFADKAQRTLFSTTQQVWEQNGITLTHNKGTGSNIADYADPVRFYQNSEIIVEHANTMTQIVFVCSSPTYATALKNSIGDAATASGSDVTVEPNSTSFTIAKLTAQVRVQSITVTYTTGEVAPTLKAPTVSVAGGSKIDLGTVITFTPAAGNTLEYAIADEELSPVEDEILEIEATTAGQLSITVKSICGEESEEYKYVYYVMPNKPVISAADDTFEESLEVSIEAEDGDIYYTLDGNDPTEDSTPYESAFTITETTTVKAIAVVDGVASKVASATYKYVDPNLVTSNSTISFANTTQRVSQTTTQQVWSNGTVNFTNNKSASQTNVVDSSNPVKCYASSSITLECASGNITEILFDCNSTSYATALNNSFDNTVISTVSGKKVTVTLDGTSNTFTIEKLSAQVRMDAVTVTYATEGETLSAPILPASTTFDGSYDVAITAEDGAVIYYTLDGNDPTKESTLYEGSFTITETTIVKAIAVKGELVSTPAMAKYTKTINLSDCTVAEVIEAYANGQTDNAKVTGYIVGCIDGSNISNAVFGNEVSTNSNILLADDPYETNIDNCIPVQLPSGNVRDNLNLVDNSDNYQKKVILTGNVEAYFSVAALKSTSAYEFVDEIYHSLTVSDAGYATLFLGFNARIPSAVEAYTVTTVNDGWVSLTQVKGVLPSNQGVIIKAPARDYKFFYEETATADVTGNLLSGSTYNKNIDEEAYVLGKVDGVVGLYKAEMAGGVWLNNAYKAYLPASALTPAQQTAAFYGFDWDGTTGIDQITDNRVQSTAIYDLTGRRVEAITAPGIYVVGGKKVLVK